MNLKFKTITYIYIIFILSLTISYAAFNTTLNITGIATLGALDWPEGILPSTPISPPEEEKTQISDTFTSNYLSGTAITTTAQERFTNVEETYDSATSTYNLVVTKEKMTGNQTSVVENFDLNFSIKNSSTITWLNGEVTNEYTSTGNHLSNVTATLDKTQLAPNDSVVVNMKFTLDIYGKYKGTIYNDEIKYYVNYLVGNEIRTTTIIINFNSA